MKRLEACLVTAALALIPTGPAFAQPSGSPSAGMAGLATVSGTVTSPAPFKAAKVYFRNADKRMQYMVYTAGGKYQAMHLFPGNYEMRVEAPGLESAVTTVQLKPGANPPVNARLRNADETGTRVVTMDEMFPAGPGQQYVKDNCLGCHSPAMFGAKQFPAVVWNNFVQLMLDNNSIPAGFKSPQEREELVAYLEKNFGPNAQKRTVRFQKETPLNEAKLGRAMYVEYYLKPNDDAGKRRRGQDPHFDQQGNVWVTDRNRPNRLTRLDPRTGEWKEWLMPHPEGDLHGLTIDRDGTVWVPGRIGQRKDKDGIQLIGFDPKTEKFEQFPVNPGNAIKDRLQSHTPVMDGAGNVWVTMIGGDRFYKWNRQTRAIEMFETRTRPSAPYGIDMDSAGNIWMALFRGAPRVAKYNPVTKEYTEYNAASTSGRIRRVSVDIQDRAWYGIHDRGILGYIDPKTGRATEFRVPVELSRPYDPQPDYEGNVWFGDDGQGGATVRFDPRNQEWSFYPSPQVADQPKIEITRDGAVWYCPRSGAVPGVGVLYPDVTKVKTLGAYYHDYDPPSSRAMLRKNGGAVREARTQ
ncbi:MAG TPA: carboxypeptidase regulatory-like domain-containing protein [Burkholderiales bacterium]|nr:carboxypeptidase regulatory-like domain-containing protein [Burkholderiales bacterium]